MPDTRTDTVCSTCVVPRTVTFVHPEDGVVVAKAGGRRDWEVNGLIGSIIGKDEKIMEMNGDGFTTV